MTKEILPPTATAAPALPVGSLAIPHTYEKLRSTDSHIRILSLHPSQDASANLRCSIQQQELGKIAGQYESISYTWGNQSLVCELYCDDGSIIHITANLHSALRRFRTKYDTRLLWADAVCINQADAEEKSQQIPLMRQIYRCALRVLVWLGDGTNGENETMGSLVRRLDDEGDTQKSESIRKFFQLPWFSRRWVIQEAVLNPDVIFHCGKSEISWPRLHLAVQAMPSHFWNDISSREVRNALQKLGDLWRTWSYLDQKPANCELFELMDSFHHFQCKEDKDRIYALASLSSNIQLLIPITPKKKQISLVPNYSLSDDEVFRQVALGRMQSGRVLTTLAYAGAWQPRDGSRTLPSWTPDFRFPTRWRIMSQDDSKSLLYPNVEVSSDGFITLNAEVDTPELRPIRNLWNSCLVNDVFPGPKTAEPRVMMKFVREWYQWMQSKATLANFGVHIESDKSTMLIEFLLTVAAKFGNEDAELRIEVGDGMLEVAAGVKIPDDFLPGRDSLTRLFSWLRFEILEVQDCEDKYLDVLRPFLSKVFRAVAGRCFFISKIIDVSELDRDYGWRHNLIALFGVGPGDLSTGDMILRFTGMEEGFFFRLQENRSWMTIVRKGFSGSQEPPPSSAVAVRRNLWGDGQYPMALVGLSVSPPCNGVS